MNRLLLDTGPLVAFLDRLDTNHQWARFQFGQATPPLLTCEAVLAEAGHLVRRIPSGPAAVLQLVERGVVSLGFRLDEELTTVLALMRRYATIPMSLADACLVRLSEQHASSAILTLDRHFHIYRRHGRQVIPAVFPAAHKGKQMS